MKNIVFVLFAFLFVACTTQTVTVDYDRHQDFNQLKSYAIQIEGGNLSELDVARMKAAIAQSLATKGMTESANPDVMISVLPEEYISQNQSSNVGIGVGGGSGGFGTSVGFGIPINSEKLNQNYRLVMDKMSDGNMIWEGRLQLKMSVNATPQAREENISKGIARLFKNFPMK